MAYIRLFRQNTSVLAAVGMGVMFAGTLIPQTVGLGKYRSILANYKDGQELAVDEDTMNVAKKVLRRLNLKPEEEGILDLFSCYGNDLKHKGCLKLRSGAIIGIPATFAFKDTEDAHNSGIKLGEHSIDWMSDAGRILSHAVVLSEKAKGFAIAREIKYTSTYHIWMDGFLKCGCGSMAYYTGYVINRLFGMRQRVKTWGRVGVYTTIGVVYFLLYVTLVDAYFCLRDNSVDKKTAKIGRAYSEGGVEFYEKLLLRNKAVRLLMGRAGEDLYTPFGNEKETVRRRHVQITSRLDTMKKHLEEYKVNVSTEDIIENEENGNSQ